MRLLLALVFVWLAASPLWAAGRPMTVDDLLAVKGVSDPQLSPDGSLVVYVVSEIDRATDKTTTSLWLVPSRGGEPKQLTTTPGTNNHPRFSPDGKTIAFVSKRSGSAQVWLLPLYGGEPRQLTKLPLDVAGPIWSPKGDTFAFVAEVYPGKTPEETAAKDKEKEASKTKVRIFDHLMIRHWTSWDEGKRSHLFVADAHTGAARDLTPKLEVNTPPAPFGGSSDYAFAPDGKEIAFTAEPIENAAWSTNTDIWTVPVVGGEPKNITAANPGADAQPAYSPDGQWLAYVSQARAGFESDQWVLKARLRSSQSSIELTRSLDRPVQSFAWAPSSNKILAMIDDNGTEPILAVDVNTNSSGSAAKAAGSGSYPRLIPGGVQTGLHAGTKNGKLVFMRHFADRPAEVYAAGADGSGLIQLTHHNAPLLAQLDLPKLEGFTYSGADGDGDSRLAAAAAGFRAEQDVPGRLPDPWRASRRLARRVAQPLELPDVRRAGVRRRRDQPARLDRLRPEVHGPDQPGLDRPRVRRPDEGP